MQNANRIFVSMGGLFRSALSSSLVWISLTLAASAPASAQDAVQDTGGPPVSAALVVPQQVRYAGKLATRTGETVEAEFRIYSAAEGGDSLWTETQRVIVGEDGSYSVLLGSVSPAGLPQTVFGGGAARWLGVSVERSAEQERVLLSSVPYAMESADAESLAGHAASDFVTQEQLARLAQLAPSAAQPGQKGAATPDVQPEDSPEAVTGLGTSGTVPLWTGEYTQGNSEITQVGSDIGINEATPAATLDVGGTENVEGTLTLPPLRPATTSTGLRSQLLDLTASAWSTTGNAPVNQIFKLYTLAAGNNTATPSGNLYFQFQEGTGTAQNILSIGSNGVIAFAPTQTFPGTITSVSATSPVTATSTSGAVSLGLNTSALETTLNGSYAQLGTANTFTKPITFAAGQTFPGTGAGTITAVTTTSPLTGSGTSGSVGLGLNTSALETTLNGVYPQLNSANAFTGNQSITGGLSATTGVQSNGVVEVTPATQATSSGKVNSPLLELGASVYNSSSSSAQAQRFAWQTQGSGNNTASPTSNLTLLFGAGTATPTSTGLAIGSSGLINFASGQTFPGTGGGTITGITTSSPLTGSGTSGSVALTLDTNALETTLNGVYSKLSGSNSFLGTETFTGFSTGILSTATSAGGTAIYATAGSATGTGVSSTGGAIGVTGSATSATGVGVEGAGNYGVEAIGQAYGVYATAASSGSSGVWGQGAEYGVYGSGGQFGLYGYTNSEPGTAGVYGAGSVGVQGGGTTYGVQGGTTSTSGIGVFGTSSGTSGTGVRGNGSQFGLYGYTNSGPGTAGVYGAGSVGVQGGGTTYGVQGGTSTSSGIGVYGTGSAANGIGVKGSGGQFGLYGLTDQAAGTAGVYGIGSVGLQGSGTVYGVQGNSSTSGGFGVAGQANQYGVYGVALGGGNASGVYGTAPDFGVYGSATGGNNTVGVYGQGGYGMQAGGTQYGIQAQVQNGSAAIAGVDGIYGGLSATGQHSSVDICYLGCGQSFTVDATVDFKAGVWADTNFDGDANGYYRPALMATADANIAGVLVNNSNVVPVLFVYNAGSGGGSTGAVIVAQGPGGTCSFTGNGDTACTGTMKSTVNATTAEGPGRVETYAVESTENWFEDAGSGRMVNGVAHVHLEPIFGQTVNTDIEYHVFLTPNDDCKGLYVTNKTASGFEVHELGGGRSSIAFEYRIMAKRLGHEKERLVRAISPRAKRPVNSASAALEAPK